MSLKRIASRYAKALVDLALEGNKLEDVKKDMDLFAVLLENREFELMLKSPVLAHSKKKSILKSILEGRVTELTSKFINLLVDKDRAGMLPLIVPEFLELYRDINQISVVKITSAREMEPDEIDRITAVLRKQGFVKEQVEVEADVDPTLIGGFILEFGDHLLDASVENQLFEMRRMFDQNLYRSKIIAR